MAGVDAVESKYPRSTQPRRPHGLELWRLHDHVRCHPDKRFHAAVAGAGIANWQSYYGENSIDQWMIPYFGATVYDDPAVYAKSSAINYISKVKTPRWSSWAIAMASAPRRSRTSSGMR